MSKLTFKYGTMFSGKSMDLLKVQNNYERQNKATVVLAPNVETHMKTGFVESRVGMKCKAMLYKKEDNLIELLNGYLYSDTYCILVDEAQFLTREQVKQLKKVAIYHNIPVICYGLKTDFQNRLFEGSEALLIYAEKLEEIKTVCHYCNSKATMNLRIDGNGNPVYSGEQIQIGDETYRAVCHKHYGQEVNN